MKRRLFLKTCGAALSLYHLPLLAQQGGSRDPRFVWVLLRGALDGMSALVPRGDVNYARRRQQLTIEQPIALTADWGLHPELKNFAAWFAAGELSAWSAVASPYRERSHFDGQNLLENGSLAPYGARDGWLNRALALQAGSLRGLAVGPTIPLALQGDVQVESWSPSVLPAPDMAVYDRLADLYAGDAHLADRLYKLVQTREQVMDMDMGESGRANALQAFQEMTRAAGKLLSERTGPRVATLEVGGWDTHANQGADAGRLANQLRALDTGLAALQAELGAAWKDTTVVVMTEFGRTVAVNGTGGTDHGTASAAFALGGAVRGGRILGQWPGLAEADLFEGRDLRPTTDSRAILKAVLAQQLGLSEAQLAEQVFPGSAGVDPEVMA